MKEEDIYFSPEALPPVHPPAERRRFPLSPQAVAVPISQDDTRRALPSHPRAFLNYRAKRQGQPHARRYTVCVI